MAMPIPASRVSKKNQAMTIFIVVTMVASTLGFALWYNQDDAQQPTPEPPPIDTPTIINYEGEASGKVVELFNRVLVIAPTEQAEIGKIDAELYGVEGVRRVISSYLPTSQDVQFGLKLSYRAEVDLDQSIRPADFIKELTENSEHLYGISAWRTSLISLPKEVSLTNPDLNLTKEHTFDDPLIQAYLKPETIKGDEVTVALLVGLAGNTISSLIAEEIVNVTASPTNFFIEKEMAINELEPKLVFAGSYNFSKGHTEESIVSKAEALDDVVSAEAAITPPWFYSLELEVSETYDENTMKETLSGIEGVTAVRIRAENSNIVVDFNESFDIAKLKSDIGAALPAYPLEITEPKSNLLLDIEYSTSELTLHPQTLSLALADLGIEGDSYQPSTILAETLENDDGNAFEVKDGNFTAHVLPTHSEGETVSLEIMASVSRGKIVSVQAAETQPEK